MKINRLLIAGLFAACHRPVRGYVSMREQNEPLLRRRKASIVPDAPMTEVDASSRSPGTSGSNPAVTVIRDDRAV